MNASARVQKAQDGRIFASKPKTRKVKSNEDGRDFECYENSNQQPVQVEIDHEFTEGGPRLALLPNKSRKGVKNYNGETMGGNANKNLCRSNRRYKPPDRLGSAQFCESTFRYIQDQPEKIHHTQNDDNRGDTLGLRLQDQ